MQTFLKRTITAIFFLLIMLGGMLWSKLSFILLFLIIAISGLWEYFKLVQKDQEKDFSPSLYQKILVVLLIPAGFLLASGKMFSFKGQPAFFWGVQLLLFLFMLLLVLSILKRKISESFRTLGFSLLGALYIGLPFSLLIYLFWHFSLNQIPILPLAIIFSLWINDTMAYIVGSIMGKTPFVPKISPNKTWEGTLGGFILTLIVAAVFSILYNHYFSIGIWIAIAGTAALFGTLGDLLESYLKRRAGVKDSGNILPGHGGILDRFDSLILAIPFVWLLMEVLPV